MADEEDLLTQTQTSVLRVVDYDVERLHREDVLGQQFSFRAAMEPAKKIIAIFKRLPVQSFSELPEKELKTLKGVADGYYQLLQQVEEFDNTKTENTLDTRNNLIERIINEHQAVFSKLMPFISYLTARSTDFSGLEAEARAAVRGAIDAAEEAQDSVGAMAKQADDALREIQKVSAEMGVSQEAQRFKSEADHHDKAAEKWGIIMISLAAALGSYALASFFIHKWEFLSPNNTYETVQLALSKLLVFGVISYLLFQSSRNFLSHKHNAVVNRHRQNALVTFKALVDAARIDEKQDIILGYAANCIYSGTDTGFSRGSPTPVTGSGSMVHMIPRAFSATQE